MSLDATLSLRRTRGQLATEMATKFNAITTIREAAEADNDGAGRPLSEDEAKQVNQLRTDYEALQARDQELERDIKMGEQVENRIKAGNAPAPDSVKPPSHVEVADKEGPKVKGGGFARMVLAVANSGNATPASWYENRFGADRVCNALQAGSGSAGGFAVVGEYVQEFIELLRARTIMDGFNPIRRTLINGKADVTKLTGGASFSFLGEGENITKSQQTTGMLSLTAKKMAGLVPVSNDVFRFASPNAESEILEDMVAGAAVARDAALIRGSGIGANPKGLRYWVTTANTFAANGTINLANVTDDLGNSVYLLEAGDSGMVRPAWIFGPRTKKYLKSVRDGNGNYAFRDEMLAGKLDDYPFAVTTNSPENLGSGTDEGEIIFFDAADFVVADAMGITIDTSGSAAYHDGSAVQAAFSRDETVIRLIMEFDCGMRHTESLSVMTEVKLGS